jgi:D-alanyl-D-alanine-carboxypeptidase/D-alanyl-D-alanine-endopeptidase
LRTLPVALVLVLVLLLVLQPTHGAAAPPPPPTFEQWASREVRRMGHPGMALAVVVGDAVVFAHGYGTKNKWRNDPVTPDTVFRIASITKVLSGLALLQLRDAGKLSLDDTLASRLPEAEVLPADPPILLRHLVTHTSGLPRAVKGSDATEADMLAKLARVHLESPPGTKTSYSNFAMGLVGPLVSRASGEPYREYLRAHVFEPLEMTGVAWEAKDVDPKLLATGHQRKKRKEGETEDPPDDPPPWPKLEVSRFEWRMGAAEAFGGLYASVLDMAKLARFELSAWRTGVDPESAVLSRASLRESQTLALRVPGDGPRYGVNWVLDEDATYGTLVFHTGATDEYSGSLQLLPSRGVAVVLLSNAADAPAIELVARRILLKAAETLESGGEM